VSTRRLGSSIGGELLPTWCVDPTTAVSHGNEEQTRGESFETLAQFAIPTETPSTCFLRLDL
jgi:hypothetical protein